MFLPKRDLVVPIAIGSLVGQSVEVSDREVGGSMPVLSITSLCP